MITGKQVWEYGENANKFCQKDNFVTKVGFLGQVFIGKNFSTPQASREVLCKP